MKTLFEMSLYNLVNTLNESLDLIESESAQKGLLITNVGSELLVLKGDLKKITMSFQLNEFDKLFDLIYEINTRIITLQDIVF